MPTLVGDLPNPGERPEEPCRWCGAPTDLRFEPEGGSRVGPVPLHLLCGAVFIRTYERMRVGLALKPRDAERMARFMAPVMSLPAGHEPDPAAADVTRSASTSR